MSELIYVERLQEAPVEYGCPLLSTITVGKGLYVDCVQGDIRELMELYPETYMISLPESGLPVVTDNLQSHIIDLITYKGEDIISWKTP